MDPKGRWQALQAKLTAARASLEAGDRDRALREVDDALAIDPAYLAAQSLRERIVETRGSIAGPRPVVSMDGFAQFESRTKRRRVDRRIEAARSALARNRLNEAANAIDEVRDLDPNSPELEPLVAALKYAGRVRGPWRYAPRFMAAAVFVLIVLGATWFQQDGGLLPRPTDVVTTVIPSTPSEPVPPTAPANDPAPVGTAGPRIQLKIVTPALPDPAPLRTIPNPRIEELAPKPMPAPVASVRPAAVETAPPMPIVPELHDAAEALPPRGLPVTPPVRSAPAAAEAVSATPVAAAPVAAAPVSATPISVAPRDDEQGRIEDALRRYRSAYDGLDAQSARDVWPAVNTAALARAFDGLESQRLTFDACQVQLRDESATVTCRGTAEYVPKVGSREPRVEPRVWNFTLRKRESDWKIESARAER